MKSIFTALALLCIVSNIIGQKESETNKNIAKEFEKEYNHNDFDSIFLLFSTEMKNALPIDKTKDFLTGLKLQAGQIIHREFMSYTQTYAGYKTKFERALYVLNISVDKNNKINGLFIKPYAPDTLPKIERNSTKMQLPFKGIWTIFWGGDTKDVNYHVESQAQKNAFDIMITDSIGRSFKSDGKKNEDYYAFGKEVIAPCDGEIVLVVDGVKDNIPGEFNPIYVPGNTVILKTLNNEYVFFAHFKQSSIRVKQGQKIITGEVLGQCGNTGNSSEPHLHFHIQNVENMNIATGVKCYFDNILVNGQVKNDYSPVKGDQVKNNYKF